jgi:hypothetical protein
VFKVSVKFLIAILKTLKSNFMKKIFLLTSLALVISFISARAQKSYFRFGVGYALPSGSQTLITESNGSYDYTSGDGSYSEKAISGTYGSGFNFGAAFGHLIGDFIGYEIELNYLLGKKYEGHDTYKDGGYSSSSASKSHARSFSFTPSIFIIAGDHKLKPRIKAGLIIGKNKLTYETVDIDDYDGFEEKMEISGEASGGFSLGFRGGIGIEFSASKNTSFYTEVVFTSMAYYPKNGELTKYKIDGVDQLDQLSKSEKEVEFVKEMSESSSDSYESDEPSKVLRESFPFGSIGLQFGLRFNLGKPE